MANDLFVWGVILVQVVQRVNEIFGVVVQA